MKCLSCGSSAEKNDDNACTYCGSVIKVDTFKTLLSIVGEVKDAFKFSTSEQTIDKLPHEEQNDSYHTHILLLIDRRLWKDVIRISTKASNRFPIDAMFYIYILISLICEESLIHKSFDEIQQIKNSIVGPHVSIGENTVIENAVIKNSIIQKSSSVKNMVIKNSMIGNKVEIEGSELDLSIGDFTQQKL